MLDVLLPPQCVTCDTFVSEPGLLCAECFRQTGFITEPMCVRCGVPFAEPIMRTSGLNHFPHEHPPSSSRHNPPLGAAPPGARAAAT